MTTAIIRALERSRRLIAMLDEDDVDGAVLRAEIDAALDEVRRLAGSNGGPRRLNDIELHARIRKAVERAGSCAAWARQVGVGKSYAFDVYAGNRPASDTVLVALGLRRVRRRAEYEEV